MLTLNRNTKTEPKPTVSCKNCSCVCVRIIVYNSYATQHRTVLVMFPSYSSDNHHSSDDVYWRAAWRGGLISLPSTQCLV